MCNLYYRFEQLDHLEIDFRNCCPPIMDKKSCNVVWWGTKERKVFTVLKATKEFAKQDKNSKHISIFVRYMKDGDGRFF